MGDANRELLPNKPADVGDEAWLALSEAYFNDSIAHDCLTRWRLGEWTFEHAMVTMAVMLSRRHAELLRDRAVALTERAIEKRLERGR